MYTALVNLGINKSVLKQHGITVIYQPMLRHIFGATSTYEPVRQYINILQDECKIRQAKSGALPRENLRVLRAKLLYHFQNQKYMIADKLDYNPSKMEIVQLSNDAYHYLAFKEPCLDEDNIDEVKEFKEQVPYGFKFEPDIEFVEDSDLVECKVIPICECSTPFTHYRLEGLWFKSEYYYNEDKTQAYYRTYDMYSGRFLDYGWNDVHINEYGKPEIRSRKCIFPLWGKSWLKY